MNCLKKAKISEKDETIAINNKDDLFKEIDESLKELREKEPSLVPQNMTAEDFATTDDAVITTSSTLTDEEILQDATQTENDEVEEIEDDNEELVAPSTRDVENSLEILQNLSLFSEKRGDQMQDLINRFETLLTRDKVKKCKQVKIASYFVKKNKSSLSYSYILYVYYFIYPDMVRSLRDFLMISLVFLDLSGHSSANPQYLAISNFLLV